MKFGRGFLMMIVFTIQNLILYSNTYYVATDGADINIGTKAEPLASVQKAQEKVVAGDTVYIRGGDYIMQESDISKVESSIFACVTYLDKSGSEGKRINYWAYPGETPHFIYNAVKPVNQRVVGFYIKGSNLHLKGLELTGIQVTILTHTESYCIYSRGSNNIFEQISMHDNVGTGLRHYKGGYNLFLNCDSYRNHDNVSEDQKGGNNDGFGCHPDAGGKGNVFKGCRAWFNSDDGFDCIRADESIIFDSCWAFNNGYSPDFESLGDGNGFKAGGYAYDEESAIPLPVPSNTIQFCMAVHNKANGFYSNHHLNGNTWYNNSAYKNAINYNMVNRESPQSQNINVNGYNHILKNNLGYAGRVKEYDYIDFTLCTVENNYFDYTITANDFVSLDESLLTAPRNEDGSLPRIDFMRIADSSIVIDKGQDIGFSFFGDAPDLGAFESNIEVSINKIETKNNNDIFPNPVNDYLNLPDINIKKVLIFDISGKIYFPEISDNRINFSNFNNGIYIINIISADDQNNKKILVKK